jgi:hypothetical protein
LLNLQDVLNLLLTTGVVTTLVTSLVNVVISLKTHRNVKDVERLKRRYQMDFMRFEKINELRLELDKYLIFAPYDIIAVKESSEDRNRAVTKLLNDNEKLIALFESSKPYFDADLRDRVNKLGANYKDRRWDLQQLISGIGTVSDEEKFDKGLPELFELGHQFKNVFEEVIDQQMRRLDITSQ